MKPLPLVLIASLAANAGLAWWALKPSAPGAAPAAQRSTSLPSPSHSGGQEAADDATRATSAMIPDSTTKMTVAGFAELRRRLEATGMSPRSVQEVIAGLLRQRLAARRAEVLRNVPYWSQPTTEQRDEIRALEAEMRESYKSIFGNEADFVLLMGMTDLDRRYGIGALKVQSLQAIETDYGELRRKIQTTPSIAASERVSQLALLDREMDADLAKLLTPDELRAYKLRNLPGSYAARSGVGSLNVTEEQYAALVDIQTDYSTRMTGLSGSTSPAPAYQAQLDMRDRVTAILGVEGADSYLTATDGLYRSIRGFTTGQGIDAATTLQLVRLQTEAGITFERINSDTTMTNETRSAARMETQRDLMNRAQALLGDANLNAFRQTQWGRWLGPVPTAKAK